MLEAIDALEQSSENPLAQVLFGKREPTFDQDVYKKPLQLFNSTLNKSQKEAIQFALSARDIALIHGPPG